MSGGPPHHPHNRPQANTAWNHLHVPSYYPTARQPQHAHMSNEHHPLMHQPTWHTPTTTTEPLKSPASGVSHLFNLEQMLSDRPSLFAARHSPGVDLSVTRNGGNNQNGDVPAAPISLSVRDTNKINSLAASALEIQGAVELKALSPGLKSSSPGLKSLSPGLKSSSPGLTSSSPGLTSVSPGLKSSSPGLKSTSPGLLLPSTLSMVFDTKHVQQQQVLQQTSIPKTIKKAKRMDSILERLNPHVALEDRTSSSSSSSSASATVVTAAPPLPFAPANQEPDKTAANSVVPFAALAVSSAGAAVPATMTPASSHDENSNSNAPAPTPTPPVAGPDDEVVSPYSNEDSLDSNKSRRKRKPSKTIRMPKEAELPSVLPEIKESSIAELTEERKIPERRKSAESPESPPMPRKTRRKTSSESETIDKIAAMVQATATHKPDEEVTKPNCDDVGGDEIDAKKDFVAVEDKLEEMFAGLEDDSDKLLAEEDAKVGFNDTSELLSLEITPCTSAATAAAGGGNGEAVAMANHLQEGVSSSTAPEVVGAETPAAKRAPAASAQKKRKLANSSKAGESKAKKSAKKSFTNKTESPKKTVAATTKKVNGKAKIEALKDMYAYDSGSNASSSKSRGPFVQIRGPRDSPTSVNVVNTPVKDGDDDGDHRKPAAKSKKFHDDSEYRHKVRSKGLHCSTLSNKYDAQTKDASWICAFCKRGPYSSEYTGVGDAFYTPGDLFGPYVISNNCAEFETRLDDPFDKNFKSKKVSRSLEVVDKKKKSKRKNSENFGGEESDVSMVGIAAMDGGRNFEVWAHEDCMVWSPGIYLVGPKIIGLEEAVWTCSNVTCARCHLRGANVCCLRRGCDRVVHLGCATLSDWHLEEETYRAYCGEHRPNH